MEETDVIAKELSDKLIKEFVRSFRVITGQHCRVVIVNDFSMLLKRVSLDEIASTVAECLDLNQKIITNRSQKRTHVDMRRYFSILALERGTSLTMIGEYMCGRDHSTVIHLRNTHHHYYDTDPEYAIQFDIIRQQILENYEDRLSLNQTTGYHPKPNLSPVFD